MSVSRFGIGAADVAYGTTGVAFAKRRNQTLLSLISSQLQLSGTAWFNKLFTPNSV